MVSVIEDTVMVNPINDSANLNNKPMDLESSKLKAKTPTAAPEAVTPPEAQVNFSKASQQLEALKASFKDTPEVDSIRVLQFKNAIASNTYQINSGAIAEKMLGE